MEAKDSASTGSGTPAERLERGEVLFFKTSPFALPQGADLDFLLQQELGSLAHKNISYNPANGKVNGFVRRGEEQVAQLRGIFARFSQAATAWLATLLPQYPSGWQLDRASFRPQEEATRCLRPKARNDLLHVDAFPGRPSRGNRILRVFANINPCEPRIWVTSDPFAKLLERYGEAAGLPGRAGTRWLQNLSRNVVGLFNPNVRRRSEYDLFMLRFHDYLKMNEKFQEKGPKYLRTFPPGSVWVAMTDTCSHSVLRGRYALEHSYFVSPAVLALPEESPPVLLQKACAASGRRAA
ncbi:MAG TPA: Kdo hydroxylase family protein [Gemmataceae bacterium]|nr:Kdo hydroxylase family protein [Gemmataceae bacterium]